MQFLKRQWQKQLDTLAGSHPKLYYALVWLIAGIGYGFLLMFPVLSIFSVLFIADLISETPIQQWSAYSWILTVCLVGISAYSAWVSLYIFKAKSKLPIGRPIVAKEFPLFFDRLEELCTTFKAQKIHQVKLTPDFDINIVRTPKSGFPFGFNNTLLVGVPVLSSMSPSHVRLLLARDIGHLASIRSNINRGLIYLRSIWSGYAKYYSSSWKPESFLLRVFFFIYAPFYKASTSALVRLESHMKDTYMFELTHADNIAELITGYQIKRHYIEQHFWPELNDMAYKQAKPSFLPYGMMASVIDKRLDAATIQQIYNTEIEHNAVIGAERPCLSNQLHTIGIEDLNFSMPEKKQETAANHFLADRLKDVLAQMDNVWYLENRTVWNLRYQRGQEEKKKLKLLHEQAKQNLLSNDEAIDYLLLVDKYLVAEKSVPIYNKMLQRDSNDANLHYTAGRLLIKADSPNGVDTLCKAMNQSVDLTEQCCQHIIEYMVRHDNPAEAQKYRRKILEHQADED